jgi:hypothetical protein
MAGEGSRRKAAGEGRRRLSEKADRRRLLEKADRRRLCDEGSNTREGRVRRRLGFAKKMSEGGESSPFPHVLGII